MVNDTIGDLITRIRNGYAARKQAVSAPYSRISESICVLLVRHGYLSDVAVTEAVTRRGSQVKQLELALRYVDGLPVLTGIKRVSSPGRRSYARTSKFPRVLDGQGLAVISTSIGVMTGQDANKKGLGGEVLFSVW